MAQAPEFDLSPSEASDRIRNVIRETATYRRLLDSTIASVDGDIAQIDNTQSVSVELRSLVGEWPFVLQITDAPDFVDRSSTGRIQVVFEEVFDVVNAPVEGLIHYDREGSTADEFSARLDGNDWSMRYNTPDGTVFIFDGTMNTERTFLSGEFRAILNIDPPPAVRGYWRAGDVPQAVENMM